MRTAILTLKEVPKSCDECPLCKRECVDEYLDEYEDECMFSDEDITDECMFERPSWCPLLVELLDEFEEVDIIKDIVNKIINTLEYQLKYAEYDKLQNGYENIESFSEGFEEAIKCIKECYLKEE